METERPQTSPGAGPEPAAARAAAILPSKPNGPVVAVMLAAGLGSVVLGLLTVLSEASEGVHDFLELSDRVGPLSGKTVFGSAAFLVAWGALHMALRDRQIAWRAATATMVGLLVVGLVLTFPPFFELFKSD